MVKWGYFSYADCYSVVSEGLVSVFEWAMMLSLVVFLFVFSLLMVILILGGVVSAGVDSLYLEFVWTLAPVIVLVFLGYPSMVMLFMYDVGSLSSSSVSVVGSQWYWTYVMSGFVADSYPAEGYRLLDVDSRLVLNAGCWSKVFITSSDVIHSWALPSLGVKMDAIPGRINSLDLFCGCKGVFYGQCSELCGVGHSFMPVCVEMV